MTGDRKFYFDRCFFFDAKPGHTALSVSKFDSKPDAKVVALSKTECYAKPGTIDVATGDNVPEEYYNLHPSICIFIYSPEQARAYADIFNYIANTLELEKAFENNKED